jgi:ELWxxDGT repeat protein
MKTLKLAISAGKTIALLLLACPLLAQTPYLVKDINTTYSNGVKSSSPTEFAGFGSRVFFAATTDAAGAELWSTDGTSAGTSMVADIVVGTGSSSPSQLRVVNGVLLFNARDVNHGIELWATDGTTAGSRLLLDINPGPTSSQPGQRIVYKNQMLFSADDGTNGRELWTTDGTASGTRILKDINPGSLSSSPFSFVTMGNSVYFFAASALWKTDGTESGTVKVMAVAGRGPAVAGSLLFFQGFSAVAGWELWVSDGTEAGTRMLPEILPGVKSAFDPTYSVLPLTAFDNRVLFVADDGMHGRELWVSDGTAAGTGMVHDFVPGATGYWDEGYSYITVFDGRAFFNIFDSEHGSELWSTDGTDAGTSLFADLTPGTVSTFPNGFTMSGGKLFFSGGQDFPVGGRLWVLDNRGAQPRRMAGPAGPGLGNNGDPLWPVNGKLYFAGFTLLNSGEPWVTDGTETGTRMIANLAADVTASSVPVSLTAAGNLLFFNATEGLFAATNVAEKSLWRSDGTAAGTFKLLETGQHPGTLQAAGSLVFFPAQVNSTTLMFSDGTIAGTKPADDFMSRFGKSGVGKFFAFGDTLFATVNDLSASGYSLWKTTATANVPATSLGSRDPYGMIDVAGRQFFYTAAPPNPFGSGKALWTTDGTPAGTYSVVDVLNADSPNLSNLVNAAGTVYFLKAVSGEKTKLWKSDGTADGTVVVKELDASPSLSALLRAAGHRVYFAVGAALWVSDGTEAGTRELVKVPYYPFPGVENMTPAGDRILFTGHDEKTGYQLWGSDGTPEGTKLLLNLGFLNVELVNVEETVYFTANDDAHGHEIWTTDGTPDGTKLFLDIDPGPASSDSGSFTRVGSLLYFSAYTSATGRELWALPLTGGRLSISDSRVLEGESGNVTARFTVSLGEPAKQSVTFEYATSDGTARAGEDYDVVSGTLAFALGETSKTIDVRVRGDLVPENNETFFVTLRNVSGARVTDGEGVAIIEDNDQIADLSIVPEFSMSTSSLYDSVKVSNAGPRTATNIVVRTTATPNYISQRCTTCPVPQLANGMSAVAAGDSADPGQQVYMSATASARQGDPSSANNTAAWTLNSHRTMAMNAAYLTTGSTATMTVAIFSAAPAVSSSNPSVVSASSTITKVDGTSGTFTVTALKPGTSLINFEKSQLPLLVTVVAPGTQPRWEGGVTIGYSFTATPFEKPITVTITPSGTAPFSGATATGFVTVTAFGKELERRTVNGTTPITFPVYAPVVGSVPFTVAYSGDASFLPQTFEGSLFVNKGQVNIAGGLERVYGSAGTFALTVRAAGSPVAAPTGTMVVLNGATEVARIALAPSITGVSIAHATLSNLPASPTLTINYLGDALYQSGSQQVRSIESRRRSAGH